jgi:hypothetical protein
MGGEAGWNANFDVFEFCLLRILNCLNVVDRSHGPPFLTLHCKGKMKGTTSILVVGVVARRVFGAPMGGNCKFDIGERGIVGEDEADFCSDCTGIFMDFDARAM